METAVDPIVGSFGEVVNSTDYTELLLNLTTILEKQNAINHEILLWVVLFFTVTLAGVVVYFICKPLFYFLK